MSAAASSAPISGGHPRRHVTLAVAIGAITIDTLLLGLIAPLLPQIERRTGASEAALGAALAVYAVPIALLSLPMGRVADMVGRRRLLIAGLTLTASGSALIAATESLQVLIAGRAVQGVGAASSWIAALALVSDLAPPGKRGEAIGFALAATGAGSIAGPALGGVTADAFSFSAPFLIVCGGSAVLAVAAVAVLPAEARRPAPRMPAWRTIAASTRTTIGAVATAIVLAGACTLGLVEVVAPLDLDARLGLSSSVIGLLFAGSIAVDASLAPLGGRWGDRRGRRGPALAGVTALAASAVLLAALDGALGAALGLAVFGAGLGLAFAAAVPWLDEAFGALDRGLAYGLLNVLYAAGYAVGPLAGGAMFELGSADLAYVITASVLAMGALTLGILVRRSLPGLRAHGRGSELASANERERSTSRA